MPCFDIDGNPVACDVGMGVVTGYGLDYEALKKKALATGNTGWQPQTEEEAFRFKQAPTSSSSSNTSTSTSTSTSYQDPDYMAFLREKEINDVRARDDAGRKQDMQFQADTAFKIAQLENARQQTLIQANNLSFLYTKQAFEESIGRSREARETQQQMFSQSIALAGMQLQIAQQEMSVQQANIANTERKQARLQALGTDIGTLAADAGDRGKYAATVLANSGWGDSTAAGEDYRTDESLTPLQGLLNIRKDVKAQPDAPFSSTGVSLPTAFSGQMTSIQSPAPNASELTLGTGTNSAARWNNGKPTVFTPGQGQQPGASGYIETPNTQFDDGSVGTGYSVDEQTFAEMLAEVLADPNTTTSNFAQGGIAQGAYIGDEKGAEIHIPIGPGQAIIIPHDKAKKIAKGKMKGMAAGGIFSGGGIFGPGPLPDTSEARTFTDEARNRGLAGTPWGNGNLPAPVFASSPGFDPIVQSLLSSLAGLRGYPAAAYNRQAELLRPTGLAETNVRRTR